MTGDGANGREHVLYAMVELSDEEIFVILGLSTLGDVNADADRLHDPPHLVVREAVSGLNPPHLTVANNSEDTDKLALLLSECMARLGG
jgi:hypothetical protein